ncbi:MAG TPA: MerR family transcriptional regulator [Solirubrobacteraceae bacterium]|nr:MerR family transcriptional regulator [Solirubrobacteraceae bacterium]
MLRTNAAATLLGISANTLRDWETRFGFPQPVRSAGGHRYYLLAEIEALAQTLAEGHGSAAALALAREGRSSASPAQRLVWALRSFSEEAADRLLEESLALRSVERTIEEVLLTAVLVHADISAGSPVYDFTWRYAAGWLSALKRLSPPAVRAEGIVLLDVWQAGSLDTLCAQALEVMLRRAGFRTLSLAPSLDRSRLELGMRTVAPRAVVLTGSGTSMEELARLAYVVHKAVPDALVYYFRRAETPIDSRFVGCLGPSPLDAREELLGCVTRAVRGAAAL